MVQIFKNIVRYLLILLIFFICESAGTPTAQSAPGDWSAPLAIFSTDDRVQDTAIVTDAYDIVHAFWIVGAAPEAKSSAPWAIYHASKENDRWARPADIILSPGGGSAQAPEIAADPYGRLHLIWHGPNNKIYYSSADGREAGNSRGWSKAKMLGSGLNHSGIFADQAGRLHVVYPGTGNSGVYYTTSSDGGDTWSGSVNVAPTASRESAAADYAQASVDSQGGIHVVWTEFKLPDGWPPLGVFYSRSVDNGATWSTPFRLASDGYDIAAVRTSSDGSINVLWNGMAGLGGRYFAQSTNQGRSWSKPVPIIPPGQGGTSGYSEFVMDATGTLHAATSTGTSTLYTFYQGGKWSTPLKVSGDLKGKTIASVEFPRIALSSGNRLNVLFEVGLQEIYYVTRVTDAPSKKSQPLPTRTPSITAAPQTAAPAIAAALPSALPTRVKFNDTGPVDTGVSTYYPLITGVVLSSLIALIAIGVHLARRSM